MRIRTDKLTSDWREMIINDDSALDYFPVPTYLSDGGSDTRWQRAELKPESGSSSWNNIYSMALRFRCPEGFVSKGFEINDVSIVYRLKSPK